MHKEKMMRNFALFAALCLPSIAFAQTQISGSAVQIGGNVPNVTDINGSSGSFTFTGPGVSCTLTTCTFNGSGVAGSGTLGYVPLFTPDGSTLGNSHVNELTTGVTAVSQQLTDTVSDNSIPAGYDTNTGTNTSYILTRVGLCPNLASVPFSSVGAGCDMYVGKTFGAVDGAMAGLGYLPASTTSQSRGALIISSSSAEIPAFEWDLPGNVYLPHATNIGCLGTDSSGLIGAGTGCSGGGGSGTVSGQAANVIPLATGATTIGAQSHIDEATAGTTTVNQKLAVNDGTGGSGIGLTEGTPKSGSAGVDLLTGDSTTHQLLKNPNNTGTKVLVGASTTAATSGHCAQFAANGYDISDAGAACGTGGGSVNVNGSSVSSPNFNGSTPAAGSNGKNVAWQVSGSSVSAEVVGDGNAAHYLDGTGAYSTPAGGGSGYTNVVQSNGETTVALINTACSSKTYYATTPLSIATGGTITCPVQFSKAGLWTIASGQVVTFNYPVTETDGPAQIFTGSGTVAFSSTNYTSLPSQRIAPVEWWGAKADGTTNSTTAIQACLNAHPVQCLGQQGRYLITAGLTIGTTNVGFAGAGIEATGIVTASPSIDILTVAGTSVGAGWILDNTFNDFYVLRTVAPTGTAAGIVVSYTDKVKIERVFSLDSVYLFKFLNFANGVMEDSLGYWNLGTSGSPTDYYGVYIDGAADPQSAQFTRVNIVDPTGGGGKSTGFYMAGAQFSDVFADWLQISDTNHGIVIDGSSLAGQFSSFDIHFKNSIIDGIWTDGIKVSNIPSSGKNSAIQFIGGECSMQPTVGSGTGTCADIESSSNVQIANMQFAQGSHIGQQGWLTAIYASSSANLDISGNTIVPTNSFNGIELNNTSGSSVRGNTINMQGGISGNKLIYLTGTSSNNTIEGNNLKGDASTTVGIQFDASAASNLANENVFATVLTKVTDSAGSNSWNTASNTVINGAIKNTSLAGSGSRCIHTDSSGNITAATGDCAVTIASGTASMGTSAISSGTCATVVTVSATGTATTDAISYNPNGDPTGVTGYAPSSSGSLYIWPYPTANNVNFKVCNNTGSSITPGALTLNWRVGR
jgi:hypothetical protein